MTRPADQPAAPMGQASCLSPRSVPPNDRQDACPTHLPVASRAITAARFHGVQVFGAIFPATAGLVLYGWRAAGAMLIVTFAAAAGVACWSRIGLRGGMLRYSRAIWLAMLLGLLLPAHLLTDALPGAGPPPSPPWLILPAAGLMLSSILWLLGHWRWRLHPAVVTYLLLAVCFGGVLTPHWSLQRQRIIGGDVLDAHPADVHAPAGRGWITAPSLPGHDALQRNPASSALTRYTAGREPPPHGWLSLDSVIRDLLPPLEDLVIGGHPGPIGGSCAIAAIIGGLFLLYRGITDFRIPLLVCLSAWVAFMLLPIPVRITENGPDWQSLLLSHGRVDWTIALTFVNYELMAGPLLLTAFFFATDPEVRPLTRRGRVAFAVLVGVLAAAAQLYLSVACGPYLALLLAGLFTAWLDRRFLPRPLL